MPQKRARVRKAPRSRNAVARDFSEKKKLQQRRAFRLRLMLVVGSLVLLVGAAQAWQWQRNNVWQDVAQTPKTLWHKMVSSVGFSLKQVHIIGRRYTPVAHVRDALQLRQGESILSLDLQSLKKSVEAIPEVREAKIYRVLPAELRVVIEERTPVALWQKKGKHVLIDASGVVLNPEHYAAYPVGLVVVGEDAPKQVGELLALLQSKPFLKSDVQAAVRVGLRRWNLLLKQDVTVKLPEKDAQEAFERFAYLVKNKALLTRGVRVVDMRLADRVFITPDDEKTQAVSLVNHI